MTDKEFQLLMDLADELQAKKVTKEEALQGLISAGILDENGNHTEPYKHIGLAIGTPQ